MLYPPEIIRLLTPEGFNQAFEEEMSKHPTHLKAYEAVEERHEHHYKIRKYIDFESFRVCRSKMIKRGRKRN